MVPGVLDYQVMRVRPEHAKNPSLHHGTCETGGPTLGNAPRCMLHTWNNARQALRELCANAPPGAGLGLPERVIIHPMAFH